MWAPPYAWRSVTVTRGVVARAKARRSAAPWRMTPARSWPVPGRKPGVSTSTTSGTPKRSHSSTNHAPFCEASASSVPPRWRGWLAMTPDRRAVDAGEADDQVAGPPGRELEQVAAVDEARGDVAHVVDRARRARAARRPGRRARGSAAGAAAAGRRRARAGARARPARGRRPGRRARPAGAPRRCAPGPSGPPSCVGRDPLARDLLDDAGPGEEHERALAGHDGEVAERRRVGRAARARAADDADLRHLRERLRAEDRRVGRQRRDALLQPRAAGVGEADDGHAERRRPRSIVRRIVSPPRTPSEPPRCEPSCAHAQTDAPADAAAARQHAVADGACARAGTCPGRRAAPAARAGRARPSSCRTS